LMKRFLEQLLARLVEATRHLRSPGRRAHQLEMLAVMPSEAVVRRLLTGPVGAEITGSSPWRPTGGRSS
jgi:hypothetical protein